MSDEWREFRQRVGEWRRTGESRRLQLVDRYDEAYRLRESDPAQMCELLAAARDEAQRLAEPWWVLFFEAHRLSGLTADLHDFKAAHPLAMQLAVRFASPEGQAHPWRVQALIAVLYTHLQVDPVGFLDELERGFNHLDGLVDRGPTDNRFVLSYRRTEFFRELERWEEAHASATAMMALVARVRDSTNRNWWGAWVRFLLCEICHALGRTDELAGHAAELEDCSRDGDHLLRTLASGRLWLAVVERAAGDERAAQRSFHSGLDSLRGVATRDEICAGPIARYYELGEQFEEAVAVRDRELGEVTRKGMLHRACRVHVERCRLKARIGTLTETDLAEARQAAARLRSPEWFLPRISSLVE